MQMDAPDPFMLSPGTPRDTERLIATLFNTSHTQKHRRLCLDLAQSAIAGSLALTMPRKRSGLGKAQHEDAN